MNLEKALQNGVDIAYKPVVEIPLNVSEPVVFDKRLSPKIMCVRGKKLLKSGKHGLCIPDSRYVTALNYSHPTETDSGLILLSRKKGGYTLVNADGAVIADEDCEEMKDIGEGLYAVKKSKMWAIFRVADRAQLTDYRYLDVGTFREGSCVVKDNTMKKQLVGPDLKPIFDAYYEYCAPFSEDIAMVGKPNDIQYITRDGKVIYSGASAGSRAFCNGYAVIRGANSKEGAIDKTGRVVVEPKYKFMKDCEFDKFVVSGSGTYMADGVTFSGKDYGLITTEGRELLPLEYSTVQVLPNGSFQYGFAVMWQVQNGNNITTYRIIRFGLSDANGNVLLPVKYVSLGKASEGMLAYKTFVDTKLTFGYITEDGKSSFEIASIDYDVTHEPSRRLLREDIETQLKPFQNGYAQVRIAPKTGSVGVFNKKTVETAQEVGWYNIDKSGKKVDPSEIPAAQKSFNADTCEVLPFKKIYNSIKVYSQTHSGSFKDSFPVKVYPFDDLLDVRLGYGFAIVDKTGERLICGSYEGQQEVNLRFDVSGMQFAKLPHTLYTALGRVADNVWLGVRNGREEIIFSDFESPASFSSGLAPYRAANGLWGYIDCGGNVVVQPQYTEVTGFEGGYAFAMKGKDTPVALYREAIITERA